MIPDRADPDRTVFPGNLEGVAKASAHCPCPAEMVDFEGNWKRPGRRGEDGDVCHPTTLQAAFAGLSSVARCALFGINDE